MHRKNFGYKPLELNVGHCSISEIDKELKLRKSSQLNESELGSPLAATRKSSALESLINRNSQNYEYKNIVMGFTDDE